MMQLPYWQGIDQYVDKVAKIYVVLRDLTNEEMANTCLFDVENEEKYKNTKAEMRFDVTVPWTNTTFLKCFLPDNNNNITLNKGEKDKLIKKLISVNNNGKEPYKFFQSLPRIVVIDKKIPATSSSMMRYFIYKYLSVTNENNIEKENYLKIKTIMFGNKNIEIIENIDEILKHTIDNYEELKNRYENNNENDKIEKIFNPEKKYDEEYRSYESSIDKEPSHGGRKPPKKRSYKKKRSNKKFRSLRKRRSYKRV